MAKACFRAALALQSDRRAVTAIEYALIAALVSITIVVAVTGIGHSLTSIFNQVAAEL
jgi:pilus assembly protein Flp/PilA